MVHPCGRELWTPASYAIHAKHCDGKPLQTRGRIERLAGRTGRELVVAKHSPTRTAITTPGGGSGGAVSGRVPQPSPAVGAIAAAATDKAMELTIAGLLAKRAQIDNAIAALEALRT